MTGKWLGSRQIRCNWATKTNSKEKPETDNHNAVVLTNGSSTNSATDASQDARSKENLENNPDCTTVYVGNLGHEVEPNYCITMFIVPICSSSPWSTLSLCIRGQRTN
ncbi:Oligouridylate-binding protein 1A [Zea mays]|uniref:Oligouridylate-binding protein 1A n=1 Tax=Zea mays TaxID=4577 RepID=A0A3L6D8P1_MAIZE|nr:Oligouridylate-binding protein 1A [Zea mays]